MRGVIDERAVGAVERETGRYYDAEHDREARPLDPRRIAARGRFTDVVRTAGRKGPILEVGTGPGRDAVALADGGLEVIGVDVSLGHARRAAANGVAVAVSSARALPVASGSIVGLWSMSTLMHIPDVAIGDAMRELARALAPGAPMAVGVWGGPDVEHYSESPADAPGQPRRLFSRRSEPRWRTLLELVGRIDEYEVWEQPGDDGDAFRYHLAFVTAGP